MTKVKIEVDRKVVEDIIKQKQDELSRINNVLNSFRSNELTHLGGHYDRLQEEREGLREIIEELQDQLEENEEEYEGSGISELFE